MKFSNIVKIEPELVRPPDAAAIIGSEQLLDDMVRAGWIKPVMSRKRLTLYSVKALRACAAKILAGECPPQEERKAS